MKEKECSLNNTKNYKISKNAILENDKKLLINKFGFHNLSQLNLSEEKQNLNNHAKKKEFNSTSNNEIKKTLNKSDIVIKIQKHRSNSHLIKNKIDKKIINGKNDKLKNHINNNLNLFTFSSNEKIKEFHKNRKSTISLKNIIKQKVKKSFDKNKSYGILPIKPLINKKTEVSNSLNKNKNLFHLSKDSKNKKPNNSVKTTATNSYKDIKSNKLFNLSNHDLQSLIPHKLLAKKNNIRNNKFNQKKDKLNNTMYTPSLLNEVKKQKIKNKEQSYKIFNDNIYIKKNLYNDIKKLKGKTSINTPIKNLNKKYFNIEEKKINSELNINENQWIDKKGNYLMQDTKIKKVNSYSFLRDYHNKFEIKKKNNSQTNENSEETRKQSEIDLNQIFNDRTITNNDKNNYNNFLNKHFNIQNDQNSIKYNNDKSNDKQRHLNYFNNLIKKNSYEQNKLNDSIKNENFSSINENNDINNIYRSSKILNHCQDMQISQEKNSAQTCTTAPKVCKISKYVKQPIYNISNRLLLDKVSFRSKSNIKNKKFIFISDIITENKSIILIDLKKILKLNDISLFKILSYSYDNYYSIIGSNKFLRNKINISLKNIFQQAIDDFKLKYKDFLNILKISFKQKKIKLFRNKNNNNNINNNKSDNLKDNFNYLFNLILECQIITKDINKSYEIGCDYISNGKKYDTKWKFDVHKKDEIKLWICTELDNINDVNRKFSYISQVGSFCYQDIIEFQFNIFSEGNNISPTSIEWTEPIISNSRPYIYQNSKYISSIPFDQLRACEVETQILFWKNNLPEDDGGIVNEFKKIFEKFFKIKIISYDVSKFYFFKFVTIANKKGWIKQNKFSTFDINIIDYKESVKNEIQCIYILNSNYYRKSMDIRVGTYVIFYVVDMKR